MNIITKENNIAVFPIEEKDKFIKMLNSSIKQIEQHIQQKDIYLNQPSPEPGYENKFEGIIVNEYYLTLMNVSDEAREVLLKYNDFKHENIPCEMTIFDYLEDNFIKKYKEDISKIMNNLNEEHRIHIKLDDFEEYWI